MQDDVRIEPRKAKEMVDAEQAIVLDVVQPAVWQQMRWAIAGAYRIEPNDIGERFQELPRERAIIAYCT